MKTTAVRCAASTRGRPRFQPSWMSPGLTSHQQLDAGIAARQQAGRKALKKSKRPFDNYFRTQFRFSPRMRLPVTQTSGVVSSFNAVKMMTDPTRTWTTPWDRSGGSTRVRRKRQDVLEPTPTAFGEDAIDQLLERLIEIRFAWDLEDGVLSTSLVPISLYGTVTHCRPYLTEVAASPLTSSSALTPKASNSDAAALHEADPHTSTEDGEVVMLAGAPVRIRRRTPLTRRKSGQPKRPHAHSKLGFSGVDTVPSIVLDVSHGPFVTSPSAPLMTLRWKGEHREAASAQSSLQLLRKMRGVAVVGLAPRSAVVLLKALSTIEVEEPALAVSLAIAMGENYNGLSDAECLEVLRCLRRLAFVRGLPDLATPDINAIAVSSYSAAAASASGGGGDMMALPRLYTEAALTDSLLSKYLSDAAPFLVGKIWARLPEQSRHLLQRGYFLDWFDLTRLAIAASGPQRLPQRLPNPVTEAPYAAKYLFFHHTLGLKEEMLAEMVVGMRGASSCPDDASPSASECLSDEHLHRQHTASAVQNSGVGRSTTTSVAPPHFIDEVKEEVHKPLILWLCASLLARIVGESLGDVVRHVGDVLHQHAALAAERAEEQQGESQKGGSQAGEEEKRNSPDSDNSRALSPELCCHPYPRFSSGAYQQIGCRRPKRVRVRLLPFEAFPRVAQCFSCPYASVTEKVVAQERQRQEQRRSGSHRSKTDKRPRSEPSESITPAAAAAAGRGGGSALDARSTAVPQSCPGVMQSTFAAVLAESPRMVKQTERACAALRWSTTMLQACHALVHDLPSTTPPPVSVSSTRAGVAAAPAASDAVARRAARDDEEWARETVAMEVRHALCYRYVRSAVQQNLDALFTYIPWGEMEAQWEPILIAGSDDAAVKNANAVGSAGGDDTFSADAPEASLASTKLGREKAAASTDGRTVPHRLSEAEQRARAMMKELRECLEEFQVAVADVLEAHEGFFDAQNQDPTPQRPCNIED
ncbi:hypothetical protein N2W54_004828 [Lotmaria passim]